MVPRPSYLLIASTCTTATSLHCQLQFATHHPMLCWNKQGRRLLLPFKEKINISHCSAKDAPSAVFVATKFAKDQT